MREERNIHTPRSLYDIYVNLPTARKIYTESFASESNDASTRLPVISLRMKVYTLVLTKTIYLRSKSETSRNFREKEREKERNDVGYKVYL